jgi:hypothetical protein
VAGFRTISTHFCRLNNPELIVRYKYLGLGQTPDYRVVIGFIDDLTADYGVDGALASKNCFLWFKEKGDSIIQNARNDGDSSPDLSSTVSLSGTNESINTIRLFADSTNNRFGISLNGASATYYTGEIPSSSTRLGCIVQFENEDSSDRAVEIYGATFRAKVV